MGVCFGEGNCYTGAFTTEKGRSLWQPTKRRNAHIRFVRVRSLRKSIAARSARRWKKPRTWIASAPIRSARVGRNTRPTHSRRRRSTRRIRTPFIGVSSTVQIVAGKVGPCSFKLIKSVPRETFWPSPVKRDYRNVAATVQGNLFFRHNVAYHCLTDHRTA